MRGPKYVRFNVGAPQLKAADWSHVPIMFRVVGLENSRTLDVFWKV